MLFNLLALTTMGVAGVVAGLLLRRHLPLAGTQLQPLCARCGTPGSSLTSFACPGCGHDVREAGLAPRRTGSTLRLFWLVVVFTFAFVLASMIVGGILLNMLPANHRVSRNVSMRVSQPEIRGVDLYLEGSGRDVQRLGGSVTGELYGAGGVVILEIELPSRRWRLLDLSGERLDAGDHLDGKVVYRWMELAGAPTDTPVAHSDAGHIADAVGRLVGGKLQLPPVPVTERPLSLSYSSSSSGGSSSAPDPRWMPLIATAASPLWLAGVYLILLSRRARARVAQPPAPAPAAVGVTQ